MTALAFILGVLPLVHATGAGAASRQAIGTAVFYGMIGNTFLGLLFTPILYVAITGTTEKLFGRRKPVPEDAGRGASISPDGALRPVLAVEAGNSQTNHDGASGGH